MTAHKFVVLHTIARCLLKPRKSCLANSEKDLSQALSREITVLIASLVAFVFNWLGFFAAYCMTKTVAGRYGAISGFGLSVVKWVLILKVNSTQSLLFIH